MKRLGWVIVVVGLLGAGCASLRGQDTGLLRDGVRYGVTEGPFRGRWWHHYERGKSYLDGGFYAEAEKDFRAAIRRRSRDQLWPRTYGLHFVPEYFPHRELGIALYSQGELEAGGTELETSLEQRFSARAAYYLGEARRQRLSQAGGDTAAPTVDVLHPAGALPVGATQVIVSGVARDDTYVAAVEVRGHRVDVRLSAPEVAFEETVALLPGQNSIPVTVTDLLGKETRLEVAVVSDVDGPVLSFDTPVVFPGTVRGVAFDPAGVQSLSVSGVEAALEETGQGLYAFAAKLSPGDLSPPVRYTCEDALGNVTAGELAPDMLVDEARLPKDGVALASLSVVPLHPQWNALVLNGQICAVAAVPGEEGALSIEFPNVVEGQEYYMDEILVALQVTGAASVQEVALNGASLPTLPGRSSLRLSRRIRLEPGENQLHAVAKTAQGNSGERQRSVTRAPTEIEMDKGKLAIAFARAEVDGSNPETAGVADYVLAQLPADAGIQDRFNVVGRDMLEAVLTEQELSAYLSSPSSQLALGRMVPAELLLKATVRRDAESVEIVLNGVSTETGVRVASHLDVAGPYSELDRLIADLGFRLVQEFPRAQGMVLDWDSPEIACDLTQAQGVRRNLKCVVYQSEPLVHPKTGAVLGNKTKILCNAIVNDVQENFASAEVLPPEEGADVGSTPIELGHSVVIK